MKENGLQNASGGPTSYSVICSANAKGAIENQAQFDWVDDILLNNQISKKPVMIHMKDKPGSDNEATVWSISPLHTFVRRVVDYLATA